MSKFPTHFPVPEVQCRKCGLHPVIREELTADLREIIWAECGCFTTRKLSLGIFSAFIYNEYFNGSQATLRSLWEKHLRPTYVHWNPANQAEKDGAK